MVGQGQRFGEPDAGAAQAFEEALGLPDAGCGGNPATLLSECGQRAGGAVRQSPGKRRQYLHAHLPRVRCLIMGAGFQCIRAHVSDDGVDLTASGCRFAQRASGQHQAIAYAPGVLDQDLDVPGKRQVLQGVSFDVRPGEFVGLIGPNGAGKSTLLRALLGIVPSRGDILLGKTRLKPGEQARLVSYLPQEREIAWPVTVERLVALGRAPYVSAFSTPSAHDLDAIRAAMQRMEIDAFADRPATELSGGEQARVLIARALAQEAPLMLADEPTAGLDPAHQIALMKTFAGLANEGSSVVACLHDLGLAARFCTRLLLIDGGRIVADGSPREVLTTERLRAIYKVEAFLAEHQGGLVVQPLDLFEG